MTRTAQPGALSGSVRIPASKSQAHRLLICAALGTAPVELKLDGFSDDILATVHCLTALSADIQKTPDGLRVAPITRVPQGLCELPCRESGSTLRFLLPVCGLLGANAVFLREGRLAERPLAPLDEQLTQHGMTLRAEGAKLYCSGRLTGGDFTLPGNISSQYITGLLLALPFLRETSTLRLTTALQSAAYVRMTEQALETGGVRLRSIPDGWDIPGGQTARLPEVLCVEGDWSSAAFFLCAGALSKRGVTVSGLRRDSAQPDSAVLTLLREFGADVQWAAQDAVTVRRRQTLHAVTIDAGQIPDLIPTLSVVAAAADGETHIVNAARLRLKESDRLTSVAQMLTNLGGRVRELPDGLDISGGAPLTGGTADACGDHRIAMSAAIAAALCTAPVTVRGSETTSKSYPRFWDDLETMKGATP